MKTYQGSGKHKTSVARCKVSEGTGVVRINKVPVEFIQPEFSRLKFKELLTIVGAETLKMVNAGVEVSGGGYVSQINAAQTAFSNALCDWADNVKPDLKLRNQIISYDRSLIVGDSRRKEKKKPDALGARAKPQKSYR